MKKLFFKLYTNVYSTVGRDICNNKIPFTILVNFSKILMHSSNTDGAPWRSAGRIRAQGSDKMLLVSVKSIKIVHDEE